MVSRPTAAQKRWLGEVSALPCANCGDMPVTVHHCAGRTAKHEKLPIGHWWILPLCPECHQGDHGVHGDMTRIESITLTRKEWEKMKFGEMIWRMDSLADCVPTAVIEAIARYRR